jgi:tetratricopeptide (TPR) repeat protein
MKRIIISAMLLLAGLSFCQAQPKIDSLKQVLAKTADEQEKAKALVMLGKLYFQSDMPRAMNYIDQSIVISKKNKFEKILADAYNVKGILYINFGQHGYAIDYLDSAAILFKTAGSKAGIASIYGNLGGLYFSIGDYDKSLEYHLKCLAINDTLGNKKGIAIAMEGVASVFFVQKFYEKAIHWYSMSLKIHRELRDSNGEPAVLINIGMGFCELNQYSESLKYFGRSLKMADSLNSQGDVAESYFGMGLVYDAKEDHVKALDYYQKALDNFKIIGNIYKTIELKQHLAEIYFDIKDYQKSIDYSMGCLSDARATGTKQYARDALKGLYRCYAEKKQFDKAFSFQTQYILLNDSILNEEKFRQLSEMQTRFDTEKKESENRLLQQQFEIQSYQLARIIGLVFGLALLLLVSVVMAILIVRQNQMKAKQRNMQLEQKLLRSQMNPHFIFNSLIAIQSFIYKNDPKEAGRYLSGFAKLIRHILENSREEYISLSKEIQTLEHYLELQKLRYDEHFDYTIEVDGNLDPEDISIPPMLAQPFIENSIEHGIKNLDVKGKIDIRFSIKNGQVLFQVTDNGVGIEKSVSMKQESQEHHSLATIITKERLFILNKRKSNKIRFVIDELKDSLNNVLGTQVSFTIPYRSTY